jgi:hypothetical protein
LFIHKPFLTTNPDSHENTNDPNGLSFRFPPLSSLYLPFKGKNFGYQPVPQNALFVRHFAHCNASAGKCRKRICNLKDVEFSKPNILHPSFGVAAGACQRPLQKDTGLTFPI